MVSLLGKAGNKFAPTADQVAPVTNQVAGNHQAATDNNQMPGQDAPTTNQTLTAANQTSTANHDTDNNQTAPGLRCLTQDQDGTVSPCTLALVMQDIEELFPQQ